MQIITKDLFEAAFLLVKGMKVSKALRGEKTVLLILEGNESLGILKSQYRQGQAEVNVKSFRKEMKEIRWFVRQVMEQQSHKPTTARVVPSIGSDLMSLQPRELVY
jgi:hypothetical protein